LCLQLTAGLEPANIDMSTDPRVTDLWEDKAEFTFSLFCADDCARAWLVVPSISAVVAWRWLSVRQGQRIDRVVC